MDLSSRNSLFWAIAILILIIAAAGAWLWYRDFQQNQELTQIDSFEECAAAGYPVAESYPRQCRTPDGRYFVEEISEEEDRTYTDYTSERGETVRVRNPRANEVIASPLNITGEVRGGWSFEADFPVELRTATGEVIATGIATLQGDWMTEDYVPFEATLEFDTPLAEEGVLILVKDNPSGLPEHDDRVEIPVLFR